MPEWPHCSAIRLQQSCSAAVITAPGLAHAMTGSAANSSASTETPTLATSLTPISLVLTMVRSNRSRRVSIGLLALASIDEFAASLRLVTVNQTKRSPPQEPGGEDRANHPTERNQRTVPDCDE